MQCVDVNRFLCLHSSLAVSAAVVVVAVVAVVVVAVAVVEMEAKIGFESAVVAALIRLPFVVEGWSAVSNAVVLAVVGPVVLEVVVGLAVVLVLVVVVSSLVCPDVSLVASKPVVACAVFVQLRRLTTSHCRLHPVSEVNYKQHRTKQRPH